jgi:hypothetical protein
MVTKLFFDLKLIKHILKNSFGNNQVCYMKAIHLIVYRLYSVTKKVAKKFCCIPSGTTLKLHKFIESSMPGTNLLMKTCSFFIFYDQT